MIHDWKDTESKLDIYPEGSFSAKKLHKVLSHTTPKEELRMQLIPSPPIPVIVMGKAQSITDIEVSAFLWL